MDCSESTWLSDQKISIAALHAGFLAAMVACENHQFGENLENTRDNTDATCNVIG